MRFVGVRRHRGRLALFEIERVQVDLLAEVFLVERDRVPWFVEVDGDLVGGEVGLVLVASDELHLSVFELLVTEIGEREGLILGFVFVDVFRAGLHPDTVLFELVVVGLLFSVQSVPILACCHSLLLG